MTQRSTAQHSSAPVRRLATCPFMPPRQLEKHEALNRSPCCSAASWALTMASGAALGAGERGSMGRAAVCWGRAVDDELPCNGGSRAEAVHAKAMVAAPAAICPVQRAEAYWAALPTSSTAHLGCGVVGSGRSELTSRSTDSSTHRPLLLPLVLLPLLLLLGLPLMLLLLAPLLLSTLAASCCAAAAPICCQPVASRCCSSSSSSACQRRRHSNTEVSPVQAVSATRCWKASGLGRSVLSTCSVTGKHQQAVNEGADAARLKHGLGRSVLSTCSAAVPASGHGWSVEEQHWPAPSTNMPLHLSWQAACGCNTKHS